MPRTVEKTYGNACYTDYNVLEGRSGNGAGLLWIGLLDYLDWATV